MGSGGDVCLDCMRVDLRNHQRAILQKKWLQEGPSELQESTPPTLSTTRTGSILKAEELSMTIHPVAAAAGAYSLLRLKCVCV